MFPRTISPGLFERLAPLAFPTTEAFAAPYDVYRFEDRVEVWMDLPGVEVADIDITVEGRDVTVSGRREAPEVPEAEPVAEGRRHGAFQRRLHLGQALSPEAIQADYRDGVLKLAIPLAEVARPRKVPVNAAPAEAVEVTAG